MIINEVDAVRLRLRPGESLVVRVPNYVITREQADCLRDHVAHVCDIDPARILVLDKDVELSVLEPGA